MGEDQAGTIEKGGMLELGNPDFQIEGSEHSKRFPFTAAEMMRNWDHAKKRGGEV